MDRKDLIDILTTVGIFAFSVALGLFNENRKKRKSRKVAPSVKKAHRPQAVHQAKPTPQTHHNPQFRSNYVQQTAPAAATEITEPAGYSFTPEEEGVTPLPRLRVDENPATDPVAADNVLSDAQRQELLRTLIVGEALASPRFRN